MPAGAKAGTRAGSGAGAGAPPEDTAARVAKDMAVVVVQVSPSFPFCYSIFLRVCRLGTSKCLCVPEGSVAACG